MFNVVHKIYDMYNIDVHLTHSNRISGVMVSVLASGQTKDYKINICCFSAKTRNTKEKEQRITGSGD